MGVWENNENIIYAASDATIIVFLIVEIILIAVQHRKRSGLGHLMAIAILILAGLSCRILVEEHDLLPSVSRNAIWFLSFIIVSLAVFESASHVLHQNGLGNKGLYTRLVVAVVMMTAAIILFLRTKNYLCFGTAILAQFIFNIFYLKAGWSGRMYKDYAHASAIPIITYIIAMINSHIRMVAPGLAIMLIILIEQYQNRVRQELAENERELAKTRTQLLADQISPHYVYNSLQSIRGLCEEYPQKARDALDVFSDYLRGNLESLTKEELIPFAAELEHTRAYLELEKCAGIRDFDVEYALEVTDFMLPPLVLQPLVENAVQHGAAKGRTIICISTFERDGDIFIEVTDRSVHGAGTTVDETVHAEASENAKNCKKKSVGLDNVRTRLALQSGGVLFMESTDEGTKTMIVLPKAISTQKP